MAGPVSVLVLGRAEVEALLEPEMLLAALSDAFVALSRGEVSMPPRVAALVPEHDGWLGGMLAHLPPAGVLGAKLVSLYPRNAALDIETHHAIVLVFDERTGVPTALLDGGSITALRTAGASALATRLLAREDARVLAVLGTGVQARSHLAAVSRVRDFSEIRVWGRQTERARAFAREAATSLGREVRAVSDLAEACRGADVVCAATHAAEPVVLRELLAPGTHVTSVGYNSAGREVDGETVRDAHVIVESRAAVLADFPSGSNDLRWPIRDGLVLDGDAYSELGEVIDGRAAGRRDAGELTLYKSVGVAVEDAAAAGLALREAERRGIGRRVEL
ncbi:MAG TPA: ornithine cyclodeaminase family protein [Candidatus Limnocylindrales bacterium]|nr:ornithine cyclodeaminase family protein [Candidatus Limnocylindrales bacterium]